MINGEKTVTVTGKIEGGKATPKSITIKNGDEEKKYKNISDVPEDDREDVQSLVKNIRVGGGGGIRFGPGVGNFNFDGNFGPEFDAQMKALEEQMKKMRERMGQGGLGGVGGPGFEQFEKQLEELRKQLRDLNKKRDKDDDRNRSRGSGGRGQGSGSVSEGVGQAQRWPADSHRTWIKSRVCSLHRVGRSQEWSARLYFGTRCGLLGARGVSPTVALASAFKSWRLRPAD